jgi:hypothetical protein
MTGPAPLWLRNAAARLAVLALSLALLGGPAGCTPRAVKNSRSARKPFIEAIQKAGRSGTGLFDMRELLPFEWDRFAVLPPSASGDQVASKLGFRWEGLDQSRSQILEQFLVLVFVKGQEVVAWIDVDRTRYSFEPFLERGYTARAEAILDIRGAGRRRVELFPPGTRSGSR